MNLPFARLAAVGHPFFASSGSRTGLGGAADASYVFGHWAEEIKADPSLAKLRP